MRKPSWDVEENKGFVSVKADDGLFYKIWDSGTYEDKLKCANVLANIRHDLNILLIYLIKNDDLWKQHRIAWGIYHTFDIHIPCWMDMYKFIKTTNDYELINSQIINNCIKNGTLFVYQEMTPNNIGLIGINKPKEILTVKSMKDGKIVDFKYSKKRLIMLTLREKNGKIKDYATTLKLAIHEITHTVCNDVEWKEDNHMYPYYLYHGMMKTWATDSGVLKVFYI
jgi:hypothetical protein